MKVIDWVSREDTQNLESSVGGLGGFFNWERKGMRWKDYLGQHDSKEHPHLEALRESIVEKDIRFGGDWHQNADQGVPLFEDNTVGSFSFRAWGDLLAAVWSEHEDQDYDYMDFYMGGPTPKKPKENGDNSQGSTHQS